MTGAQAIALYDVSTSQAELLAAQYRRRKTFAAAREQGATWDQIGRAAGLTEGAARAIVKRARS